MTDPSGNEMDKVTENSIQMRAFVMANKLDKAAYGMAHAVIGKKTKAEIIAAMNEATEFILEVKCELVGK